MGKRLHPLSIVLLLLAGCEAQASPSYRGEALLTLTGSVELDSERERGELVPALAFYNSETGRFYISEVEVDGEFPADFTLRVFDPPPAEAVVELPSRPASAIAYLTAVTPDHPDSVVDSLSGAGVAGCTWGLDNDTDQPDNCEITESWCRKDGSECYQETRTCPAFDSPPEDCDIISSSGDPKLREDPWEKFAGWSQEHVLIYLEEPLAADDPIALAVGLPGLPAGYNLFQSKSDADKTSVDLDDACVKEALQLATDRYNDANGTDYPVAAFAGPLDCAPGEECIEPPPPEAYKEFERLRLIALSEVGCMVDIGLTLVEDPSAERIAVRIGFDVRPGF